VNEKTISVIALSNRDFPSFAAKLAEAVQWLEIAASHGADLAVLPETLNLYRGDGVGNPLALTYQEAALDDWETATAVLREAAVKLRLAVTVPVVTREGDHLTNSFFLIDKRGQTIGHFQKLFPTPSELAENILPGRARLIEWEGLKIGGAICFDTCFDATFTEQAAAGAQLFLIPSLWPGGNQLNYFALKYSTPMALAYPAWSRIIDIDGTEIAGGGYRHETLRFGFGIPVYTATLNFDRVALYGNHNQEKIVAVQQAYGPRVRVRFDQQNCLFFLESRARDLTVAEVMKKFDLISARQYFAQAEKAVRS
jgi:predicted amidohydrolase